MRELLVEGGQLPARERLEAALKWLTLMAQVNIIYRLVHPHSQKAERSATLLYINILDLIGDFIVLSLQAFYEQGQK